MDDPSPQERARTLLERNALMTLATADATGRPWATPLFYALDDDHRLYWTSDIEARHSANVRETGAVSLVVHDAVNGGRTDAVYADATAAQIDDRGDARAAMAVLARRDDLQPPHWRVADVAEVTGDGPWRIYIATRSATWVRARTTKDVKPVATREAADY